MTNSYAPSRQPAPRNRTAASSLTNPVRYPSGAAAPVLTKRAFLLILMTLLVPGSAQTVAGNRRLGRFAPARHPHRLGAGHRWRQCCSWHPGRR